MREVQDEKAYRVLCADSIFYLGWSENDAGAGSDLSRDVRFYFFLYARGHL